MAEFDESKVINALHTDKAEVGKKYWYSDNIADLKTYVEGGLENLSVLAEIDKGLFILRHNTCGFYLLYPYEEPPKKRMANVQLMEWLSKGNGMCKFHCGNCYTFKSCLESELNDEVAENIVIRSWDSEEWIEPTVDIYERDCRGGKE